MGRRARSVKGVFLAASLAAHLLAAGGVGLVLGRSAPLPESHAVPIELVPPAVLPTAPVAPVSPLRTGAPPSRRASVPRRQPRPLLPSSPAPLSASQAPLAPALPESDRGEEPPAEAQTPAPATATPRSHASPSPVALRPPQALQIPSPSYPISARRRGAEGLTLVRVRVGTTGEVLDVQLSRSSGAEDLDRSALEAARSWRFRPGARGGRPVEAWVSVPVRFRLESERL